MPPTLSVRDASDAELHMLALWTRELHEDEGSVPMDVTLVERRLKEWIETGSARVVIFTLDRHPVGYALVLQQVATPYLPAKTYLRQFFIARDHRGQGLGKLAFALLEREIFTRGQAIRLEAKWRNPRAQAFWKKMGFVEQDITYERQAN